MKCAACNFHNEVNTKFCTNCGNLLSNSQTNKQQRKNYLNNKSLANQNKKVRNKDIFNNLFSKKSLWLGTTIIVGAFLIYSILDSRETRLNVQNERQIEKKSENPFVEAKVFEIASKFVCGCGSCGEESLDICTCNYAVRERQYIRDFLENSTPEEHIVKAVINKYGGYKIEQANNIQAEQNNVNNSIQLDNVKETVNTSDLNSIRTATFDDRNKIYSFFECPCGKCGIKELSECTCNHASGAIEVKKFIDMQIGQNKFSTDQIVDKVANMYGGRK